MKFVSEDVITQTLLQLEEAPDRYRQLVENLSKEQPNILAYFFQEDFSLLTQDEHEYLLYLLIVIWQSIRNQHTECPPLSQEVIGQSDEHNWEILKDVKNGRFRERVDIFFENYPQEDLLAFVEDALTHDEDEAVKVSNEGREYLFIALKSIIDAFHKSLVVPA